ncbi:MAG: hypothetical protein R3E89_02530 [Thiolinea sp.]
MNRFVIVVSVIRPGPNDLAAELMMHGYLNFSAYMKTLLSEQEGLDPKEAEKAEFFVNSMVEALAPNNFASTNPQVWKLGAGDQW